MKKKLKNYAFIDSQNLNLGVQELGWKLNLKRFRVYLKEKYGVKKAYLFLGYMQKNRNLYRLMKRTGYELIFKEVVQTGQGKIKGNCDAELVLQAMIDLKNYKKAVIVTGDGDFACLIKYLDSINKLKRVIVPNRFKYSALIKKSAKKNLDFINGLKDKLALK